MASCMLVSLPIFIYKSRKYWIPLGSQVQMIAFCVYPCDLPLPLCLVSLTSDPIGNGLLLFRLHWFSILLKINLLRHCICQTVAFRAFMGSNHYLLVFFLGGCLSKQTSCNFKPEGDYQSCSGCHYYMTCAASGVYTRPCPANLNWDDNKKTCEMRSSTCGPVNG